MNKKQIFNTDVINHPTSHNAYFENKGTKNLFVLIEALSEFWFDRWKDRSKQLEAIYERLDEIKKQCPNF